ncbi:MAG: DUF2059 domain-containing protein [Bryobacteraceae bacterium]|jgi:uncharacterized protein
MAYCRYFGVLALTALVLPALAEDTRKAALAEEILALNKSAALMQTVLDQYHTLIQEQIQKSIEADGRLQAYSKDIEPVVTEYENKVFAELQKALNWTELKPRMVSLYADEFSEEELTAIVAFYKTTAGQSFLKKMPELTTKAMQVGQQQVQSAMPEIQRLGQELKDKANKIAADKAKQQP